MPKVATASVVKDNIESTISTSGVVTAKTSHDLYPDVAVKVNEIYVEKNEEVKKALILREIVKTIPIYLSDYQIFAGTQDDAFARSYALINPSFKVEEFSGYCDPAAVFSDIEPNEEFTNWFNNENTYNRFGIDLSMGNRLNSISIQKYHDNTGIVVAITNKGKTLSRYLRNNVLSGWDYDTTNF